MAVRPPPVQAPPAAVRLAERLLAEQRITQDHYQAAVIHYRQRGGRIEEALIDVNALTEAELLKWLAAQHKTRYVSSERLARAELDRITLDKVPRKLAERFLCVPVVFDAGASSLSVLTPDPDNVEMLDEIQKVAGVREVKALVGRPAAVQAGIKKFYGGDLHAFAMLDRKAHEELTSMMNVFERQLLSEDGMHLAAVEAETKTRERVLTEKELQTAAAAYPRAGAAPEAEVHAETYAETLNVLVSLLEGSRPDLRGHSAYVARLARKFGERIGLARADLDAVVVAAYLHDLGKMGNFHLTALNVSEYEAHRTAAQKGWSMPRRLMEAVALHATAVAALDAMYERYDGKGLPAGVSGKDIPLGARVLAIADTFADLTQNPRNPFRKTLRPQEACDVLTRFKGGVFDPNLVDLFRTTVSGDDIRARILSSRHLALLVDGDPEETMVLELRLLEQGFEVKIARSGEQALKLLEAGDVEVVVSELDLAPMDGFVLMETARKAAWGRDLPWILLTRRQSRNDAQKAFELGVVDYVLKPAAADVLVTKMKQVVRGSGRAQKGRGVTGSLSEMALPDLVQILWHGRKSGNLRLRRNGESGELHFADGNVVNAMWARLRGEEAFYAMLALADGDFTLDPDYKPQAVMIHASPEALLLEGMRRLDEGQRSA